MTHRMQSYFLLLNVSILLYYILKGCCFLLYIGNIKYISWSYFLTFTENQVRHFGKNNYSTMVRKKVGRITIHNIKNCYVVIKKK